MPTANLTDRKIASLKPGNALIEWWDEKTPGFGIRVSPEGTKTWFVMYRIAGLRRRLKLGRYPEVPLVKARKEANTALLRRSEGIDRVQEKKAEDVKAKRERPALMRIYNLADQDLIIGTLNRAQPSDEALIQMVERYAEKAGAISRDERRSLRLSETSKWLRIYIDEWLTTGLNPDGSESPRKRDLFRTNAGWETLSYLEEYPPVVSFSVDGSLTVTIGDSDILGSSPKWNDFFLAMTKEAQRLFTAVMASDWKQCICKCRHAGCGRYFVLRKPRQSYRHGTFCCREHQRLASALACTTYRRFWVGRELIDVAARKLVECRVRGPGWHEDTMWKRRLATAISKAMSHNPNLRANRKTVKANWVARHWLEIEQRRLEFAAKPG